MRGNKTYFHIGLPKTGTTYLQRHVFPKIESIYFGNVDMLFGAPVTKSGNKKVLYSNERITDDFFSTNALAEVEQALDNIKAIFGDVGIIVGFRPQEEFLTSLYCQYIKVGGDLGIEDFYKIQENENGLITDDKLNWSNRLSMIEERFSNVLVYTNEGIRRDLGSFLAALGDFMEVEKINTKDSMLNRSKNRSIQKSWALKTLRATNRYNNFAMKSKLLPSLNNRLFRNLKITPRRLLQNQLYFIGEKQFSLPSEMKSHLKTKFESDWEYIESRVDWLKNPT